MKLQKEQEETVDILEVLEQVWEEFDVSQHHRSLVNVLLKNITGEETQHKMAQAEIAMTQKSDSYSQIVEKNFVMRCNCLAKIVEVSRYNEEPQEIQREIHRRLKDLRKLTISLIQAIIEWEGYLNFLASLSDYSEDYTSENVYISDVTGENVIASILNDTRNLEIILKDEHGFEIDGEDIFVYQLKTGVNAEPISVKEKEVLTSALLQAREYVFNRYSLGKPQSEEIEVEEKPLEEGQGKKSLRHLESKLETGLVAGHLNEKVGLKVLDYTLKPLDVFEDDLGSYLFDYFEKVNENLKVHFSTSTSIFRHSMEGFLTQQYFQIVKTGEDKTIVGFISFGLKSYKEIKIVHISTVSSSLFSEILREVVIGLFASYPMVVSITLYVRYSFQEDKNNQWYIDPAVKQSVVDCGFKLKGIHSDLNRKTGLFAINRVDCNELGQELINPKNKDPGSSNAILELGILFTSISNRHKANSSGKVFDTQLGHSLSEEDTFDFRAGTLVALTHYAQFYSKWAQGKFKISRNQLTVEDLMNSKEGILKMENDEILSVISTTDYSELKSLLKKDKSSIANSLKFSPEISASSTPKLKSTLVLSKLNVALNYSEFAKIPIRYATDEAKVEREYIKVRAVDSYHSEPRYVYFIDQKHPE